MTETIYDAAVIGAGMFGSAAAKYLSMAGLHTLIIGPDEPTNPASHQGVFASYYDEARITRIMDPDPHWGALAANSIAAYPLIEKQSKIAFHHRVGCLHVAELHDDGTSAQEAKLHNGRAHYAEFEVLNGKQTAQEFPYFQFPQEIDCFWERGTAGYINPRKLVQAQLIIAQTHGARLVRQTLHELVPEVSAIKIITREGAIYYAQKVLLAAGAYSKFLLTNNQMLLAHPMQVTLAQVEGPCEDMPTLIYPLKTHPRIEGIYLLPPIQYPDGNWYIKIGAHPHPVHLAQRESEITNWFHGEPNDEETRDIRAIFEEIMPRANILSYRTLPCADTYTENERPLVTILEKEDARGRIGLVSGGNGRGAKSSDAIGKLGAELLLETPIT